MQIEQTTLDGCMVVTLHGRLEPAVAPRLRRVLLRRLAERPVAVICDLSGLSAIDPACATLFAAVASHPTCGWSATPLLLCRARPAVAAQLGQTAGPHLSPMYTTVEDAVRYASSRAPLLEQELILPPSPTAPAAARRFVREVCWAWHLKEPDRPDDPEERAQADDLVERAVLLADELVTNAVVHAGSAGGLRLRVALHDQQLQLAVHDAIPRLLRPVVAPDPEAEGGRGLVLVEELATAWGVHPRPEGKVVWCVLDHR